jgi:hypothetical protein
LPTSPAARPSRARRPRSCPPAYPSTLRRRSCRARRRSPGSPVHDPFISCDYNRRRDVPAEACPGLFRARRRPACGLRRVFRRRGRSTSTASRLPPLRAWPRSTGPTRPRSSPRTSSPRSTTASGR